MLNLLQLEDVLRNFLSTIEGCEFERREQDDDIFYSISIGDNLDKLSLGECCIIKTNEGIQRYKWMPKNEMITEDVEKWRDLIQIATGLKASDAERDPKLSEATDILWAEVEELNKLKKVTLYLNETNIKEFCKWLADYCRNRQSENKKYDYCVFTNFDVDADRNTDDGYYILSYPLDLSPDLDRCQIGCHSWIMDEVCRAENQPPLEGDYQDGMIIDWLQAGSRTKVTIYPRNCPSDAPVLEMLTEIGKDWPEAKRNIFTYLRRTQALSKSITLPLELWDLWVDEENEEYTLAPTSSKTPEPSLGDPLWIIKKWAEVSNKKISKEEEVALNQPGASWEITADYGLKIYTAEETSQREKMEQEDRINTGMRNFKVALQLRSERDALLTTISLLKDKKQAEVLQAGTDQSTESGRSKMPEPPPEPAPREGGGNLTLWFVWYHAMLDNGFKCTLTDVAKKSNYSKGYIKGQHAIYQSKYNQRPNRI